MKRWLTAAIALLTAFSLCACEMPNIIPPYITSRYMYEEGGEYYNPFDPQTYADELCALAAGETDPRGGELLEEYLDIELSDNIRFLTEEEAQEVRDTLDILYTYLYHYDYVNDNSANTEMAMRTMTGELAAALRKDGYFDRFFDAVDAYRVQQLLNYVNDKTVSVAMDCGRKDGVQRYLVYSAISSDMCSFDGGFCADYPWKLSGNTAQYTIYVLLEQKEGSGDMQIGGWILSPVNWTMESICHTVFSAKGVYEEYHDERDGRIWERLREMQLAEREPARSNIQRYNIGNLVDEVLHTWYVLHPGEDTGAELETLVSHLTPRRLAELEAEGALDAHLDYTARENTRMYLYNESSTTGHIGQFVDRYTKDGVNYYWCDLYTMFNFRGDEDAMEFYGVESGYIADYDLFVLLEEQPDGSFLIDTWGLEEQVVYGRDTDEGLPIS